MTGYKKKIVWTLKAAYLFNLRNGGKKKGSNKKLRVNSFKFAIHDGH